MKNCLKFLFFHWYYRHSKHYYFSAVPCKYLIIIYGQKNRKNTKKHSVALFFSVSYSFVDQFPSFGQFFTVILITKKWTSGTIASLGLRPRPAKLFPWFIFCDLDNWKNLSSYFEIFLLSWKQNKQCNKIQFTWQILAMKYLQSITTCIKSLSEIFYSLVVIALFSKCQSGVNVSRFLLIMIYIKNFSIWQSLPFPAKR